MDSTIILATYNGSKYITEQLQSIEKHSPKDTIVQILDDCSGDNTVDLIKKYICHSSLNIYVNRNTLNLGPNCTFIKLLKSVDTKNVIFCDQDDIWIDDRVSATNLSQSDFLISKFSPFEEGENRQHAMVLPKKCPNFINTFIKPSFPGCCLSGKTEVFQSILKNCDLLTMYDWFLTTDLVLKKSSCAITKNCMFYYRRHSDTVTKMGLMPDGVLRSLSRRKTLVQEILAKQ